MPRSNPGCGPVCRPWPRGAVTRFSERAAAWRRGCGQPGGRAGGRSRILPFGRLESCQARGESVAWPAMKRGCWLWPALALAALVALIYWPSLGGEFLWDDDDHLTKNPAVNDPAGLPKIWSSLAVSRYYPLTLTSFWAQRQLWGLNPLPFRVVNLLVHIVNALLLWALLRRWQLPGAWLGAALWAAHPVNVESVAWITELKNTQSFLFLLLCLHAYWQFVETGRRRWYALALLACAAAFTSKPSTVTLPAMLLVLLAWQRRQWSWRMVLPTLPFFAMAAGMSLLTIVEQHRHVVESRVSEWDLSLWQRLLLAPRALWFYAGKLVWPVPVMFVYPRWTITPAMLDAWVPALATVVVAGGLVYRRAVWGWGVVLFVCALLPVLGLFNIYYFRFSFVADHFNYIGSAVLLALLGTALARWRRPVAIAVATLVLLALAVLSGRHARVFRSDFDLWSDTVRKNPSAYIAHNNLAALLKERGEWAAAVGHWRAALDLCPTCWEPWMALGKAYRDAQRWVEALECFGRAHQLRPDVVDARYGLGMAYFGLERWAEAREQFEAARELRPDEGRVKLWLGDIALRQARTNEAVEFYVAAVRDDPGLADAFFRLGQLRQARGEMERARNCYEAVLRLRPGDAAAQAALAELAGSEP